MPQVSTYKNLVVIVDQELVGDKRRKQNFSGFHPMIRADEQWETADNIRGLLSRYQAVYRGSKGFALVNYGAMVDQLRSGVLPGAYESGPEGIGRLRKQLQGPNEGTNIVFNYTITPSSYTGALLMLRHDSKSLSAWDSYGNKDAAAQSLLAPGEVDIFKDYMLDGLVLGNGTFDSILSGNLDTSFLDHTTIIYLADSDKEVRDPSGLDLQIEPTYNFYASTTPPYELVSGGPLGPERIKEYHLPNVYFLESELRNTGSALLATYHLPALTLDGLVNWFETRVGIAQTVTSEVEDRFYDAYSEGLRSLAAAFPESYDIIDTNLQLNNKNFAILHRDLSALDDERVTEDTLPFYNRIVLGNDINEVAGKKPEIGILRYLSNNEDTRDFIDILQMETIIKLSSGTQNLPTREFTTMVKKFNSSPLIDPNDWNFSVGEQEYTLLYDLKDMIEDYEENNRDVIVANLINTFSSLNPEVLNIGIDASNLNFRLIRDYQIPEDQNFVDYQHVSNAYIDMFEADDSPSHFSRVHRSLGEVYKNNYCHTETLLYVIKKKLTPNGAPIQTYYVSPSFSIGASAKSFFYDTQIKYGKEYYYEFEKVVVIFGNQYQYHLPVFNTSGPPKNFNQVTMKVSNLPSIKVALVPYVIPQSGIRTVILDKPPVPPELSFYAHKGIDNKVKILLNSSTGEFQAKPVIINETDTEYFINEYRSQTADFVTIDSQVLNKKITFKSDDPVDRYQLFRLDTKPQSYADFANTQIDIDPHNAIPGSFEDIIEPNRKYYYCARSVDIHSNVSNPGHIYEIEIINNNGQIFMRQQVVRYETSKPNYSKQGRRFLYIEPSLQQVAFQEENESLITEVPNPQNSPDSNILGVSDVDKVWDKVFKIRLTSKKTGRKIDLNLTFKNTGITNTSE